MRVFQLIMAGIAAFAIFCTAVCGFWIKNTGEAIQDKASSLQFHTTCGTIAAISIFILLITMFIKKKQ